MKLTKTQKNFRKQIKKLKYNDGQPASYNDRNRTVKFVTEERKSTHPIIRIFYVVFFMFLLPRIIGYIIHIFK